MLFSRLWLRVYYTWRGEVHTPLIVCMLLSFLNAWCRHCKYNHVLKGFIICFFTSVLFSSHHFLHPHSVFFFSTAFPVTCCTRLGRRVTIWFSWRFHDDMYSVVTLHLLIEPVHGVIAPRENHTLEASSLGYTRLSGNISCLFHTCLYFSQNVSCLIGFKLRWTEVVQETRSSVTGWYTQYTQWSVTKV